MNSIVYLGMDVHQNSYNLCAYNGYTGEILGETRCSSDIKFVLKFIENVKNNYVEDIQIK